MANLTNKSYSSNMITVIWNPASSSYCDEVFYYQVVISSDDHTNIPDNIVNTTCLTTTFLDLRSNTTYAITVTAVNRAGSGIGVSIPVSTSVDLERQLPGIAFVVLRYHDKLMCVLLWLTPGSTVYSSNHRY